MYSLRFLRRRSVFLDTKMANYLTYNSTNNLGKPRGMKNINIKLRKFPSVPIYHRTTQLNNCGPSQVPVISVPHALMHDNSLDRVISCSVRGSFSLFVYFRSFHLLNFNIIFLPLTSGSQTTLAGNTSAWSRFSRWTSQFWSRYIRYALTGLPRSRSLLSSLLIPTSYYPARRSIQHDSFNIHPFDRDKCLAMQ